MTAPVPCEHPLCGLILAAGASTRMGEPKALLSLPVRTGSPRFLLADQVERLACAGCERIVCVLGADAERIEELRAWELPGLIPPVVVCRNPRWREGAFTSLQAGLATVLGEPDADARHVSAEAHAAETNGRASGCSAGVIVLPVDVPGVSRQVFEQLVRASRADRGAAPSGVGFSHACPDAVVPIFAGRGGHPVWLSRSTVARILCEPPAARLDQLLRGMRVARLPVEDPRVVLNVNTSADWQRFLESR
jgi:CTP:molybdopterin cytidylyltransferase MocA